MKTTKHIKIKLKSSDIADLNSAIDKIIIEQKKVGFKTLDLSEDEVDLLKEIKRNIE